jgi:mRNA-degrading endonuclease RelE of RelBE toxin-antitoxin system
MTIEASPIEVRYTDTFRKNVKRLYKKYPSIRQDVDDFVRVLQQGETPGDRVQSTGAYVIYKARLKISGSHKGKSSGYRAIYWVKTAALIVLLSIYVKSEQSDISAGEIRSIVTAYAADLGEDQSKDEPG